VFALLDAGADDAIVTKRPWYNLAVEYSEGMVRRTTQPFYGRLPSHLHLKRSLTQWLCLLQSALAIAKFDVAEYDDSPAMLRIAEMLESAALGEWDEQKAEFRRRLGTDEDPVTESEDSD
jgi:hypothetical protein